MGKVDVAMRLHYEQLIVNELDGLDGDVAIVWDRGLIRRLNIFISMKTLSEHGVVKSFLLDNAVSAEIPHMLYILSPTMASTQLLINNFLEKLPEHDMRLHRVVYIPECPYVLHETLKSNTRVWSRIEPIKSMPIHWFPTEHCDFLHLALPELPSRMLVDGDWNYLYKGAIALRELIGNDVKPPVFYCKGVWSARIIEIVKRLCAQVNRHRSLEFMQPQKGVQKEPIQSSIQDVSIDNLVLIDRWLDPLTPLLTQFTFGGAVDEIFGIDIQGKIKMPVSNPEGGEVGDKPKETSLHDEIYDRLQTEHINAVGGILKSTINELKKDEEQGKLLASIAEYKSYVANVAPKLVAKKKSLDVFTELATMVQARQSDDFYVDAVKCEQEILANVHPPEKPISLIENAIVEEKMATSVIRLIALQSLVNRGLKPATFQHYRKLFIQTYGVCELERWLKLQISGLIRAEGMETRMETRYAPTDYQSLSKRYMLSVPEVDEIRRSDTSYAYNGRASLLVRYIEEGLKDGWREFTKTECDTKQASIVDEKSDPPDNLKRTDRTAVFIVGGITRSEVSAIRTVSKDIGIFSTAVINGRTLLDSFKKH